MSIYGVLIGIGFIIIIEYLLRSNLFKVRDLIVLTLCTLVFSRLIFLLHNIPEIINSEINPIAIWDGGLTIHGARLGILLSTIYISKRNRKTFFKISDLIFLYLPLAQAIGRFGNYFNHEIYGKPTNSLFGIYIPLQNRLQGYIQHEYFLPTFAYESVLNILNLIILLILKKKNVKTGYITAIYLINYSIIRLLLNTVRIDKEYFFNIETSNIYSLLFLILGIIFLIYLNSKKYERFHSKDNL